MDAYNERNLAAFLECYANEIKITAFPDELICDGIQAVSNSYSEIFNNPIESRCEVIDRIVLGNTVVDKERIIMSDGSILEGVTTYRIAGEKIVAISWLAEKGN